MKFGMQVRMWFYEARQNFTAICHMASWLWLFKNAIFVLAPEWSSKAHADQPYGKIDRSTTPPLQNCLKLRVYMAKFSQRRTQVQAGKQTRNT